MTIYLNTDRMHAMRKQRGLSCEALFERADVHLGLLEHSTLPIRGRDLARLACVLQTEPDQLAMYDMDEVRKEIITKDALQDFLTIRSVTRGDD